MIHLFLYLIGKNWKLGILSLFLFGKYWLFCDFDRVHALFLHLRFLEMDSLGINNFILYDFLIWYCIGWWALQVLMLWHILLFYASVFIHPHSIWSILFLSHRVLLCLWLRILIDGELLDFLIQTGHLFWFDFGVINLRKNNMILFIFLFIVSI